MVSIWAAQMLQPYDGGLLQVFEKRESAENHYIKRFPVIERQEENTYLYATEEAKADHVAAMRISEYFIHP